MAGWSGRRAGTSAVIALLVMALLATVGWAQVEGQEPAAAWPDLSAADVRAVLEPMGFEVEEVTIRGRAERRDGMGAPWSYQYFGAATADGSVSGALMLDTHEFTELLVTGGARSFRRPAAPVPTLADAVAVGQDYLRALVPNAVRWELNHASQTTSGDWVLQWNELTAAGVLTNVRVRLPVMSETGYMGWYLRGRSAPADATAPEPVITAEEAATLALAEIARQTDPDYQPYVAAGPWTVREVRQRLVWGAPKDGDEPRFHYVWVVKFTGLGRTRRAFGDREPFKVAGVSTVNAETGEADGVVYEADVIVVNGRLFTW